MMEEWSQLERLNHKYQRLQQENERLRNHTTADCTFSRALTEQIEKNADLTVKLEAAEKSEAACNEKLHEFMGEMYEMKTRIRTLELLLSRCVPWLEKYQWHLEDIDVAGERNSELDALLAEITEGKHGK